MKNIYINRNIFIILLLFALVASCKRVVIKIDSLPGNTPKKESIFITGNFNNWDPGDEKQELILGEDSAYYIELPPAFGNIEYKFTRGDWTTVEQDICGNEIDNRSLFIGNSDTISTSIKSWKDLEPIDCPQLTIKINDIPADTPEEDIIALASNFNSWDPDEVSVFKKNNKGELLLTLKKPANIEQVEFKMTRGNLSTSEVDEYGEEIPNRVLKFGKKDTVNLSIKGWTDFPASKANRVVLLIKNLPKNTPQNSAIFLASNINSWNPGDKNFQFQRNKNGDLFFPLLRKKGNLEYKITRGDWESQETDKRGRDISNRTANLQKTDTILIDIERWKDIGKSNYKAITVVLNSIPSNTPEDAGIYLAGDFNNWDPGKLRYKFQQNSDDGKYYAYLPKRNGAVEFRITRGSWESAEIGEDGKDLPPLKYQYRDIDSIFLDIANWKDTPRGNWDSVTLVINELPKFTPKKDKIYLSPDFNNWNPKDKNLVFKRLSNGKAYLTIPVSGKKMEYKITRGSWNKGEVDKNGDEIENKILFFGFKDTVNITVDRWLDYN